MGNILIVDDEEGIREALSEILENEGHFVKCVGTGKQAIRASYKQFFNIALVDVQLPDMLGTTLLNKLKKTEPEMIKIIITGHPSLENSIEAANKGINGYVLKPLNPKKLLSMIAMQLKKQLESVKFSEKKVAEYIETRHNWMRTSTSQKEGE